MAPQMTFEDAVIWLHGRLGNRIEVDVGATDGDPEVLLTFAGHLASGTANPLGAGGDLGPPDPSLWCWVEDAEGRQTGSFVIAPYYVTSIAVGGRKEGELLIECGPLSLKISA